MKICQVEHYQLCLPLKSPFVTSYGKLTEKKFDIYRLKDEQGNYGIGELVSFEIPDYIEETIMNDRQVIHDYLLPLLADEIKHPKEITQRFQVIQGNFMAKSAIETAVWDLYGRRNKQSLTTYFNSTKDSIAVGVSIGIQPDEDALLKTVTNYLQQGYQRIKLKIKPGYDFQPLSVVRQHFPELLLMADANSAYTEADWAVLKKLDQLNLSMIEQPFSQRDFVLHGQLQKEMQTPLCLDENIRSVEDVKTAVALGSCKYINLKIPRVGGITEALKIIEYCEKNQIGVWLGGMFESGIGRALNLQFASQDIFNFPGDISGSDRYYYEDIVTTAAQVVNGKIEVPQAIGIGIELNQTAIEKYCESFEIISIQ